TAVMLCAPGGAKAGFQVASYGAVVTSAPSLAPSSFNCTPATPTLSVALAETEIAPETMEPADGAVMETAGGVVSATVTLTAVAVAVLPAASRATAVSVCAPMAATAVFQLVE